MPIGIDPAAGTNAFYNAATFAGNRRQQGIENQRNRLLDMYAGNQDARAQAQEQRVSQQFGMQTEEAQRQRQMENAAFLYKSALSVVEAPDPVAQTRALAPQLQQLGIPGLDLNALNGKSPDEIRAMASQVANGLRPIIEQGQDTRVQSAQILANGNLGYLTTDGRVVDTGQKAKEQLQLTTAGGAPAIVNLRQGDYQQLTTPEQERAAAAAEAGAVRAAQEGAAIGAIAPRAAAERTATAPQRAEQVRQVEVGVGNTIKAIDTALAGSGSWTTGFLGSMAKAVPGSPAYDLSKTLLTIKANIGFDRLQQMRAASPTGGALGQVAVQELDALQASIASIDQAQSPEALRRNLRSIKTSYENWRDAVREANSDVTSSADQGGWSVEVVQ